MRILCICQYYRPEPFRIADICEELVRRGHEVTVITGTPNYPEGRIYPGYENGKKSQELLNGVRVYRCRIHPRKTGALHRLWNYYSFVYQSLKHIKKTDDAFDVVFINQLSPVMMAKAGIKYARKKHIRSVLYCLDLWPESLNAVGIGGGLIYRWFDRESRSVYRKVDSILTSSRAFDVYFREHFEIKNVQYLPQYAETIFSPEQCRKKPNGSVDLMFAGNVGLAQSMDTILKAAVMCKDIENLKWHIVGDGKDLARCADSANKLKAPIIFWGRRPESEMPRYYAMADAMLVTMKKERSFSLTLPGKVQSYMAAGKPIIGAVDGETARVIGDAHCGMCCPAEDAVKLAQIVRQFTKKVSQTEVYSRNALQYYERNFAKNRFFAELEKALNSPQNGESERTSKN